MNKLSINRRTQISKVLCEGNYIRSTARIINTAINTVINLLRDVGDACLDYQTKAMNNRTCKKLQSDEIWSTPIDLLSLESEGGRTLSSIVRRSE